MYDIIIGTDLEGNKETRNVSSDNIFSYFNNPVSRDAEVYHKEQISL